MRDFLKCAKNGNIGIKGLCRGRQIKLRKTLPLGRSAVAVFLLSESTGLLATPTPKARVGIDRSLLVVYSLS